MVNWKFWKECTSYACEILSYGLMYLEFLDSIREGDGLCILRCWHYLLLIFKANMRKNYAIEALNLLSQYHFFLTPRPAEQLVWSRCINTCGLPGRNIPADLHMEHLNRICKQAIANLGALLNMLVSVWVFCLMYTDSSKDMSIILQQAHVFAHVNYRKHNFFKSIQKNSISLVDKKKLLSWMKDKLYTSFKFNYYSNPNNDNKKLYSRDNTILQLPQEHLLRHPVFCGKCSNMSNSLKSMSLQHEFEDRA